MRLQISKMSLAIFLVPIGIIIISYYGGGIIGALLGMNMVNECSNCDDFVVNGLRGYESLGYLGNIIGRRIGLIFGIITSIIILGCRIIRKSKQR
ncbi:hypothetical protein [Neobacillus sp. LXY-4]|uniref:hypothetical protein n=1 Tax=Neobacillus sp. LXY-4 TaxID=3379826 RepID=UPI003EDF0F29